MKQYDVLFLHPPRFLLGFWRRLRAKERVLEYCFLPMGVFSVAAALDEEGYEVKIVNLGVEQNVNPLFNVDRYARSTYAKIYAIDVQWVFNIASALKLATICKKHHPNSLVVLGGMTATWFHNQIMEGYPAVDVVLRGEVEFSMPQLVHAYLKNHNLDKVDGITYRQGEQIKQNPIGKLLSNLNDIDPTRLGLLDKYEKYLLGDVRKCGEGAQERTFWLPIIRGCPYNCVYCGGGRYAYSLLAGRKDTIVRSPRKVAEDIKGLQEKGVKGIKFNLDPQMGGNKYCSDLFNEVKNTGVDIAAYTEVFRLPQKKFIEQFADTFHDPIMAISPESPYEEVRRLIGREFSNQNFFKTLETLRKEGVKSHIFFNILGLFQNGVRTWFGDYIKFVSKVVDYEAYVIPPLIYTIDPNCLLAVNHKEYGVRLLIKTLEDYKKICESTNDSDLIGHETKNLSGDEITTLTYQAGLSSTRIQMGKRMGLLN